MSRLRSENVAGGGLLCKEARQVTGNGELAGSCEHACSSDQRAVLAQAADASQLRRSGSSQAPAASQSLAEQQSRPDQQLPAASRSSLLDGLTEKEIRRLRRVDLLEMLVAQGRELERTRTELAEARAQLAQREIAVAECGSIAEAALKLNGVFEAAQAAADQYLQNVRRASAGSSAQPPAQHRASAGSSAQLPAQQHASASSSAQPPAQQHAKSYVKVPRHAPESAGRL